MTQSDANSDSQALQTTEGGEVVPTVADFADELASSTEAMAESLAPVKRQAASADASRAGGAGRLRNLDLIMTIPVTVEIILGSAKMPVASLVKLGRGAIIPLDRKIGEPVDVVVNGRLVARGEVVLASEDSSNFGIKLTEVVAPSPPAQTG